MDDRNVQLELALAPTLQALGGEAREDLAFIASMGLRAVQLSATQPGLRPRELDGSARRGLRATLRRLELELAGIDLWIPLEHFAQPEHVDRAVAAVRGAIELAADLGRCPLSLVLPPPWSGNPESPSTESIGPGATCGGSDEIEQAVRAMIDHSERFGVEMADHAVPHSQRDEAAAVLGWGIDPAAWLAHGEDPAKVVALAATTGRIASARLVDLLRSGMRGPPGIGPQQRLDTLAYRVALSVAGYRRPVVLDARQWADVRGGMREAQSAWDAAGAGVI